MPPVTRGAFVAAAACRRFYGTLPSGWGEVDTWTQLQNLYLNDNNLTGGLPQASGAAHRRWAGLPAAVLACPAAVPPKHSLRRVVVLRDGAQPPPHACRSGARRGRCPTCCSCESTQIGCEAGRRGRRHGRPAASWRRAHSVPLQTSRGRRMHRMPCPELCSMPPGARLKSVKTCPPCRILLPRYAAWARCQATGALKRTRCGSWG